MSNAHPTMLIRAGLEVNLGVHIYKATNSDETAPKKKHVRACILYSWDHISGMEFWKAIKVQPLYNDEIKVFKALITIHTVIQEGHISIIKEAQTHGYWITALSHQDILPIGGDYSYSRLVRDYVEMLIKKLNIHQKFHRFNGIFEYKGYNTLNINNQDDEFEIITDLMDLQDVIFEFQRLVFSSSQVAFGRCNECKISSLTPMIAESYGIFKFTTHILRVLYLDTGSDALELLRSRSYWQYRKLKDFYDNCSNIRYLNGLITIPKLTNKPPNLFGNEEELLSGME